MGIQQGEINMRLNAFWDATHTKKNVYSHQENRIS